LKQNDRSVYISTPISIVNLLMIRLMRERPARE
jgi:hypothetical protein